MLTHDINFVNAGIIFVKETILLTSIASISLSETGVRFGWRVALPPTAVFWGGAGTLEPESA